MIEAAIAYAGQDAAEVNGDGDWEQRARLGFAAFTEMVALQPAAARLALLESYCAGPEAVVLIENAVAGFEWLAGQMLEQSPERAGMPTEMISAHIGAQQEIARTRLRRGEERGYVDTTVEMVLKRGQMSASTFYAHFHGKDDAMLAFGFVDLHSCKGAQCADQRGSAYGRFCVLTCCFNSPQVVVGTER
jgi:hypothetical protein